MAFPATVSPVNHLLFSSKWSNPIVDQLRGRNPAEILLMELSWKPHGLPMRKSHPYLNDIENVGKTAHHHTMFEMLGELRRLPATKLNTPGLWTLDKSWVAWLPKRQTLHDLLSRYDTDSYKLLIEVGGRSKSFDPNRRQLLGNWCWTFWPDTEIFLTVGEAFGPRKHWVFACLRKILENDRYIEIWNIVLSQFNADPAVP